MTDSNPVVALLGEKLRLGSEEVKTDQLSGQNKVIGLYFSAHWCPPCRSFTPKLVKFYTEFKQSHARNDDLSMVFISSDKNNESFDEYYAEMPWHSLPYDDRARKVCMSVCVCLSVCLSLCMYVCMYVWMFVFMYVCVYIMYVCIYVCLYICMYVCMYVCVCMYICMYYPGYVCMYVCMYVYMYVCVCVCVCVFTYIHIYIHTYSYGTNTNTRTCPRNG